MFVVEGVYSSMRWLPVSTRKEFCVGVCSDDAGRVLLFG